MNQDRFNKIDALLEDVLDVPTLEREEILDERCVADSELKQEVISLLDSLKGDEDFIENSKLANVGEFFNETGKDEFVGEKIGAYRLKKLIGRGGMSAVYLASRIDDFEREVAIKIIPPFENRKRSAENFRRERQILAKLTHPFIAQILDGGTTENGKPYLVMEFVEGVPLDDFCVQNNLNERETLELFRKVCQTVSFAHSNFIVHRDLKPPNILVQNDGTPKLLDFGIAKLLDADNFGIAEAKTFDGNALTLEYASPEQITGENITAASDVYSLGVILYELLTNKKPLDLKDKPLAKIVKTIQTKEPVAPSNVGKEKRKNAKTELDFIVLKSLANSPKERYQSVEEFEQDIENYLEFKPVSARPANAFYNFRKLLRRRKVEFATGLVIFLTLFGWLATSLFQATSARRQAAENRREAYSAEMILAAKEYNDSNLLRMRELVEKYETNEGVEDIRHFEWYFLKNILKTTVAEKVFTHPDEVWGISFSPDGKKIVSAANDNKVRIWDVKTEKLEAELDQRGAWKISFFPDGKRFAVSSSSGENPVIVIYDLLEKSKIKTLRGHTQRIRAVAVSPDGKIIVSGSKDSALIVWNAENGEQLKTINSTPKKNVNKEIYDIAFSPDGKEIAVVGGAKIEVFDTKNWQTKKFLTLKSINKNFFLNGWKLVYSPTGNLLAATSQTGQLAFIETENFEIQNVFNLHKSNIKSFAFSPDGKMIVTSSWDRSVKVLEVETGLVINHFRGHYAGIHDIAFSPDGKTIATSTADFKVNFWQTDKLFNGNTFFTEKGFAAFDESADETIIFGKLHSSKVPDFADITTETNVPEIRFSPDFASERQEILMGKEYGEIVLFNLKTGKERIISTNNQRYVRATKFSADGSVIFSGEDGGWVRFYKNNTLEKFYEEKLFDADIESIALSKDEKFLAIGGKDRTIKILNPSDRKVLQTLGEHTRPVRKIAFSPDGTELATSGADSTVIFWNVSDWKIKRKIEGLNTISLAYTPDGKRIATANSNGVIQLWNTENGEEVLAFQDTQKTIRDLFFIPDGTKLISIGEFGNIKIWNGGRENLK